MMHLIGYQDLYQALRGLVPKLQDLSAELKQKVEEHPELTELASVALDSQTSNEAGLSQAMLNPRLIEPRTLIAFICRRGDCNRHLMRVLQHLYPRLTIDADQMDGEVKTQLSLHTHNHTSMFAGSLYLAQISDSEDFGDGFAQFYGANGTSCNNAIGQVKLINQMLQARDPVQTLADNIVRVFSKFFISEVMSRFASKLFREGKITVQKMQEFSLFSDDHEESLDIETQATQTATIDHFWNHIFPALLAEPTRQSPGLFEKAAGAETRVVHRDIPAPEGSTISQRLNQLMMEHKDKLRECLLQTLDQLTKCSQHADIIFNACRNGVPKGRTQLCLSLDEITGGGQCIRELVHDAMIDDSVQFRTQQAAISCQKSEWGIIAAPA